MREFLKGGHAEEYEGLSITWIPGHTPELTVMNDEGEVLDTVKLAPYTTDGLHELLESKGFMRKVVEGQELRN